MRPAAEQRDDTPFEDPGVWREIEIDADPEQVWEALANEDGRAGWLEPDPGRELRIEEADPPNRLVWWWWRPDEAPRRVEIVVVPVPAGSRVIVIETAPSFPLTMLAASLARPFALA